MLYTVYGLHEAGKPNEIEYVGCTAQRPEERLAGHVAAREGMLPVNIWAAKVIAEGKQVKCRILTQTENVGIAFSVEKELIADFAKCGLLHNVQDNPNRRTREEYAALKVSVQQTKALRLEKAMADMDEALSIVQAKIADGSMDIQAFLLVSALVKAADALAIVRASKALSEM